MIQNIKDKKLKSVNRELILKIEKYGNEGVSIAYDNNKIVFVRYVIPGETVKVKIYKETKDFCIGEPVEIIESSKDRIPPVCKYFGICGGCDYQMLNYNKQIEVKKNLIEDIFYHFLKENIKINEIITSNQIFNYRNTETFKVGLKNKNIGFFRKDTKSIVDIEYCHIAMPGINKALKDIRESNKKPEHNFKVRTTNENDTVVNWIKTENYQDRDVIETINVDNICLKFKISKDSFFQVNNYIIPLWLKKIISYLNSEKNERIFDLYCGIGLITLFVSFFSKETIGVEIQKSAIIDANYNLKVNNIKNNITFIESSVENIIKKLGSSDVIIIDPPRRGVDNITIKTILEIKPDKIIYSSCKPITLARDLTYFLNDYYIEDLTLVDMFPQTHHSEMVVLLKKKNYYKI